MNNLFTFDQFKSMLPHATIDNLKRFYDPILETCTEYEINTPKRISGFIAQLAVESGSLKYVREIYSGEKYDVGKLAVKLGNTPEDDGDGERYKGRGLIQITGLANYKKLSRDLNVDFVNKPELLELPQYATLSAGWYWNDRKLNKLADDGNFAGICTSVNGSWNGWEERLRNWYRCKEAFHIP